MKPDTVALLIAAEYHGGTLNKHDQTLYLLHPIRVAEHAGQAAGKWGLRKTIVKAVAYLHDAVEDTDLTLHHLKELLLRAGVSDTDARLICDGVDGMTKRDGESLEDYLYRCKDNPYSRCVKLDGDIRDNLRRNHRMSDPDKIAKFAYRYSRGTDILS